MGKKTDTEGNFFIKYFYFTEMLHEILEILEIFKNLIEDWLEGSFFFNDLIKIFDMGKNY